MSNALTNDTLARFREERTAKTDTAFRIAQNAVCRGKLLDIAVNHDVVSSMSHNVSHRLDTWEVTNQKQTGRCWLFSLLNVLRAEAMTNHLNLKSGFEFSQVHIFFFDKLERSNYFLNSVAQIADRDVSDRELSFLLDRPLDDGGQWNMAVNLISKYGLVPKEAMPETECSSASLRMNRVLSERLRKAARDMRALRVAGSGAGDAEVCKVREEAMGDVWRILCVALGTPPESFRWQWTDKDDAHTRFAETTPLEFADRLAGGLAVSSYVCLVNDPRNEYGRVYTVKYLGNVVGGAPTLYLNVPSEVLLALTRHSIVARKRPVWFGCDVGKAFHNELGLWHKDLFQIDELFGASVSGLSKRERLEYGQTLMTHAMVFTGVDADDAAAGGVTRLRVENSWSADKVGVKGYQTMDVSWFHEHVFEISAPREDLKAMFPDLEKGLDSEPIELPPWDPMGALA